VGDDDEGHGPSWWQLAPALFAGNAVILKPATETPVIAVQLGRALDDAGLPAARLGNLSPSASVSSRASAAVAATSSGQVSLSRRALPVTGSVPA
jgi:aldehyde dehydrogenase (NAD+)